MKNILIFIIIIIIFYIINLICNSSFELYKNYKNINIVKLYLKNKNNNNNNNNNDNNNNNNNNDNNNNNKNNNNNNILVKEIIIVYNTTYSNTQRSNGLGDFIRGSYFLMQLCNKLDIKYNIIIKHPIFKYLKNINKTNTNITSIEYIDNKSKSYLNNTIDNFIVNTNKDNIFNDYINIIKNKEIYILATNEYPVYNISNSEKEYMKYILEPSDNMNDYVNNILNDNSLIKKKYIIIHIRTGDKFLIHNNTLNNSSLIIILKHISDIMNNINDNDNSTILLISDNKKLKEYIKLNKINITIINNNISHLNENQILNDSKIKDTLLDFYLIANSKYLYSFTPYQHGSGFAQWCAITYDIPYSMKLINL